MQPQGKKPLDEFPYPQDHRVQELTPGIEDGTYVYAIGLNGRILVLPDGPHLHPRILGDGRPALYAGDITINSGRIVDLTNLSGTFQFDEEEGLLALAFDLLKIGFEFEIEAIRYFPMDGSRPRVLYLE